ncbi:MAG: efflux RND transporter periplasmic adaptor subunit [Acidithiobacillus sp.]|nr:efflux RND transporter periplasmic adaptor subunit [Acidithiobacillus sp.]
MMTFFSRHYAWVLIGIALTVLLIFSIWVGRRERGWRGRVLAPLNWYSRNLTARRLTIDVIGAALILWGVHTFTQWVTPALRPSQMFTPPVVGPQPVRVSRAKEGTLDEIATYTGSVKPWEDDMIYARVNGWVHKLNVYPGDIVHQGELLVTQDITSLRPKLANARAQVVFWQAEYQRDKKLYAVGAISAAHFDATRMRFRSAQAALLQVATDINYATIRSPLNGVVAKRQIYPGVYVHKGEMMLKVDDLRRIRIQFDVDESDLQWIHPGTIVYIRFPQLSNTFLHQTFPKLFVHEPDGGAGALKARVAVVFPQENPITRTELVEVHLNTPHMRIQDNTYVVGNFVQSAINKGVLIPTSALTTESTGRQVVFVAPEFSRHGSVQEKAVEVGLKGPNRVQILKGITVGESVVTQGNRALVNGQPVDVLNGGGGQ